MNNKHTKIRIALDQVRYGVEDVEEFLKALDKIVKRYSDAGSQRIVESYVYWWNIDHEWVMQAFSYFPLASPGQRDMIVRLIGYYMKDVDRFDWSGSNEARDANIARIRRA